MDYDLGQGEHGPAQQNGAVQFAVSEPISAESERAEQPAQSTPHRGSLASSQDLPEARSRRHEDDDAVIADEVLAEEDERPTVELKAWIRRDDYWQRTTYIALTGRQTSAAPLTRPLPRPQRFRRSSPMRSGLILLLTLALIVLIPVGVLVAKQEAEAHIKIPTAIPGIPGLSQSTPTLTPLPTAIVKPTATPKKKR